MKQTFKVIALVLGLSLGAMMMTGCNGDPDRIDADFVKSDMTPELESVAMSHEYREMRHARTIDHNMRQIWDDLDYILLLDDPLNFSKYYIP